MLVFVCLTNILLITSLISLLSASLSKVSHVMCFTCRREEYGSLTVFECNPQVMEHSRDEYLFVYVLPIAAQPQCLAAPQAMLMAVLQQILGLRAGSSDIQQIDILSASTGKFRVFLSGKHLNVCIGTRHAYTRRKPSLVA